MSQYSGFQSFSFSHLDLPLSHPASCQLILSFFISVLYILSYPICHLSLCLLFYTYHVFFSCVSLLKVVYCVNVWMSVNNEEQFFTLKQKFFSNHFWVFMWTHAWRNCRAQLCNRRALTHHPAGSSQPLFSDMTHNAPLPTHAEAKLRWHSICFCFLNPMKGNGVEMHWICSIDPPLFLCEKDFYITHDFSHYQ